MNEQLLRKYIETLQNQVRAQTKEISLHLIQQKALQQRLEDANKVMVKLQRQISELQMQKLQNSDTTIQTKEAEKPENKANSSEALQKNNQQQNRIVNFQEFRRKEIECVNLKHQNESIQSNLTVIARKLREIDDSYHIDKCIFKAQKQILLKQISQLQNNQTQLKFNAQNKQWSMDILKKTTQNQKKYINEQALSITNLTLLLNHNKRQIQALQQSNQILRKQSILALQNQQQIRKDLIVAKTERSLKSNLHRYNASALTLRNFTQTSSLNHKMPITDYLQRNYQQSNEMHDKPPVPLLHLNSDPTPRRNKLNRIQHTISLNDQMLQE